MSRKPSQHQAPALVLGATGLLGSRLVPLLASQRETVTHARSGGAMHTVDLTNHDATDRMLDLIRPDLVINLAALTDVDLCERCPQRAYLANVKSIENVTQWILSRQSSCHLIQLSTDQVYDGPGPHSEGDVTIVNTYGLSKYAGELAALRSNATVLRTNFFGRSARSGRESFSDWLVRSLNSARPIQVFEDVSFSPLSLATLATLIVQTAKVRPQGVFNLGASDGMSKADFASTFATELGLPTERISRTSSSASGLLFAKRPSDMRMDSRRIESALGIRMPLLRNEIELTAREYRDVS